MATRIHNHQMDMDVGITVVGVAAANPDIVRGYIVQKGDLGYSITFLGHSDETVTSDQWKSVEFFLSFAEILKYTAPMAPVRMQLNNTVWKLREAMKEEKDNG